MSKYRDAIYYDFKSRYLVILYCDYWHNLVLKIPFPDHIFSKILKLIINEPINKSRCNENYNNDIYHIQLKIALKRKSLYRTNNGCF